MLFPFSAFPSVFSYLWFRFFLTLIYMFVCRHICVQYLDRPERTSDLLEWELNLVVSCPVWVLWTKLWSSAKAASAFSHWDIFPSTFISDFKPRRNISFAGHWVETHLATSTAADSSLSMVAMADVRRALGMLPQFILSATCELGSVRIPFSWTKKLGQRG